MTEKIIDSINHYSRTGEIQDMLVPFFRQTGRWVGDCRQWPKATYRLASSIMHQAVLPEGRRTAVNANGEPILLTSFHFRKRRDVEIPWVEVRGSVKIKSLEKITAAKLRSVGGSIYSTTDAEVHLPALTHVGGDLDFQGTLRLSVPLLTEVGGSIMVLECALPCLEEVGNRLWGYWITALHVPRLRSVGGSLEIEGAHTVMAPELQWVCFDLRLSNSTIVFCANRLVEVGGSLDAGSVITFRAAALRTVGETLNTGAAVDFYRPEFEELLFWSAHPGAELHWEMREAVRRTMRDLLQIEI
ncbi:MAG: hypothetical protein WCK77_15010 [Verrucomicrobiota bacterium]